MIQVPTGAILGASVGLSASRLLGVGPVITSVVPSAFGASTALDVTYSYAGHFNHLYAEVYTDAGLTPPAEQIIDSIALDGSTGFTVGFPSNPLNPGTQYWIRMKLSNDGGSTYSPWSNVGTGTTAADPLAGLMLVRLEGDQIIGLSNGDPVALWPNAGTSGATNDAVQATSNKQPIWNAADADFNGKPSVTGDASNDVLDPSLSLSNPFTVVFVFKSSGVNVSPFQASGSNTFIAINRNSFAVYNGATIVNDTTPYAGTSHIFSMEIGAESRFYVDGVDVTLLTVVTADWGPIVIGFSAATGQTWDGKLAALGVMLEVNTTKRQLIEATWKAKYGTP